MLLDKIIAGNSEEFNVVIEIPADSIPVKYEMDKESGALFVDRFVATSMMYPANYGFIPHTLAEDGDPTDVLVVTPYPLLAGSVVKCRAIDILFMEDESGIDAKILALPTKKSCLMYAHVDNREQLPPLLLDRIRHYFENYKALEKGKWVKVTGWGGIEAAKEEIQNSIARYK